MIEIHVGLALRDNKYSRGIGDAVCGLYAACGLANAGHEVVYHCRHTDWLRVEHSGVTLAPHDDKGHVYDMGAEYRNQLAAGTSRKQWYCDQVARAALIDFFEPAQPGFVDTVPQRQVIDSGRYALLFPQAMSRGREWPVVHWARLAHLLVQSGIDAWIIAQDAGVISQLGKPVPGIYFEYDKSADWVLNAMLKAVCVVGNDSGMVHVAGLYGVPTVAVHSMVGAEQTFSHTGVRSVTPDSPCSPCAWLPSNGFAECCKVGCSALYTVSPDRVMEAVADVTKPVTQKKGTGKKQVSDGN